MSMNMGKTAAYFQAKHGSTVHVTSARTVSVKESRSNNRKLTAVVSIASDLTRLSMFFILTENRIAEIKAQLWNILPENTFGCCQDKYWIDQWCMKIWPKKFWKPYSGRFCQLFLLLDDFSCRKSGSFIKSMHEIETNMKFISRK